MPKSPKGPRKGRKSARLQKGQQLFTQLCELFRPHVEPLVRQDCLAELSKPPPPEDKVQELLAALRAYMESAGAQPDDIDAALKEAEPRIRDPKTITQDEIDGAVEQAATEECGMLVMSWLNLLALSSYQVAQLRVLELSSLDDAMLPPMDEALEAFFAMACDNKPLGVDASKGVLRAVKAGLPAGEQLPAEALELLDLEGITTIKGSPSP